MKRLSPTAPLGRVAYLAAGLALAALKFGVDWGVSRHFGQPWSWLMYVDPTSAPLLRPGEIPPYWAALSCVAMPFVAVGLLLTLRRLRDAGASPWLALFFFVPFANLLFFVGTALLPPYRAGGTVTVPARAPFREQDLTVHTPTPPRSTAAAILYAAALGCVVALGGFGVSVGLLGRYGYGLALGTPFIAGFVSGAFVPRLLPGARFVDALLATVCTFAVTFGTVVLFALEGAGCLVVFLPLLVVPALVGAALGFSIGRALPVREHALAASTGVLMLLAAFGAERLAPPSHRAPAVETAIDIDAPPEVVWPFVVRADDMPTPTEYPFSVGIAYPVRATLERDGVGAVRRCDFNTGTALETVTVWEPARRLRFRIDSQPAPLRELTLYRTVHQPHLDDAVRNETGELELVPLDGGRRTRLVGRSVYSLSLSPARYWEGYTAIVVHAIHRRVLGYVKARAERGGAAIARVDRATPPQ